MKQAEWKAQGLYRFPEMVIDLDAFEMLQSLARAEGTQPVFLAGSILSVLPEIEPQLRERIVRAALNRHRREMQELADTMGRILFGEGQEKKALSDVPVDAPAAP